MPSYPRIAHVEKNSHEEYIPESVTQNTYEAYIPVIKIILSTN